MRTTLILLVMLAAGFGFWKYNDSRGEQSTTPEKIEYTVRKGDTLTQIAAQNNTTVHAIQKINRLKTTKIHPGQTLTVTPEDRTQGPIADVSPPPASHSSKTAKTRRTRPNPPRAQIIGERPLPKSRSTSRSSHSLIKEFSQIAIDIDDKNRVYLKNAQGKFTPAGTIIYGSEPDAEGREVKTITYRDPQGRNTTLRGSATPEDVIRLAHRK